MLDAVPWIAFIVNRGLPEERHGDTAEVWDACGGLLATLWGASWKQFGGLLKPLGGGCLGGPLWALFGTSRGAYEEPFGGSGLPRGTQYMKRER